MGKLLVVICYLLLDNELVLFLLGVILPGKIVVVGATGLVGGCFIEELLNYFSSEQLVLLASSKSAGKKINIAGNEFLVEDLAKADFKDVHIAFFSAGARVSMEYAPRAFSAGAWVIDNSSAFRSHMPLIVPEVNMGHVKERSIISNPNCAVIPLVLSFHALRQYCLKSASVVTFQSVSGSGKKGIDALQTGLHDGVYPVPISDNVIPIIDDITSNGFTKEEMKLHEETARIMDLDLPVTSTNVRVPVLRGHSMAVYLTADKPWDLVDVGNIFASCSSISVVPDLDVLTPKTHVSECPGAMVSRIRVDHSDPNKLLYWVVSDNLLKGAALNAIQIAQHLGLFRELMHDKQAS